ncbi:hypothetical protein BCE02nite_44530 [Brevibacillus centrosporus]|nr:hypothetical protein BCE02nite_44530 [Brevibacillus centrosporus]
MSSFAIEIRAIATQARSKRQFNKTAASLRLYFQVLIRRCFVYYGQSITGESLLNFAQ